jgi:hypothetical protein
MAGWDSNTSGKGQIVLGKWYRIVLVVFGAVMGYFGVVFIVAAFS